MQLNTIDLKSLKAKADYWQRTSEIEHGRNQVLKMAAAGHDVKDTLTALCQNAQVYNPNMLCSVLALNDKTNTLHPMASLSLPESYCNALDGVEIGLGVGSCGTAAFTEHRVIVEDINTHPYWAQYKELALSAGLQSCWSEPIKGAEGKIYGTFAMYYREPKEPNAEDILFIEMSANLAAVVFENDVNRKQLLAANQQLTRTLDDRSQALAKSNKELELALEQQVKQHTGNISNEKIKTTRSLVIGIAHEVNSPMGTALTAISSADSCVDELVASFTSGEPISKQKTLSALMNLKEMVSLNSASLTRATELLERFKEIDSDYAPEKETTFELPELFEEIQASNKELLGGHALELNIMPSSIKLSKTALSHVIFQLIENSVAHGFTEEECGVISINASLKDNQLVINYQDNGQGIREEDSSRIFEPFYVGNRGLGNLGLGLNIATNIIKQNYSGNIYLRKSPKGARFEIGIPLS